MFEDVLLMLWRMPEHAIVDRREVQILSDAGDPCRYSFDTLARRRYYQGDLRGRSVVVVKNAKLRSAP